MSAKDWSKDRQDLINCIRSLSSELEPGLRKESWIQNRDSLNRFENLSEITKATFAPPRTAIPAQQPAPVAAQTPAPSAMLPRTPVAATRHSKYAPALNQEDLVQALIRYQQNRGSRTTISASRQRPEFSPTRFPTVATELKSPSLAPALGGSRNSSNRNAGIRIPVLRTKTGNGHGGE